MRANNPVALLFPSTPRLRVLLYFTMFLPGRDPLATASMVSPREADILPTPLTNFRPSATLLGIFYSLHMIGGQIGFPLVLFMIGIRRVTHPGIRHPLFLNFYATWIISSLSFCLLLYTGIQSEPDPLWSVCVTQAVLIYSVPVLTGSALWAIVFHLWLSVHCVLQNKKLHRHWNIWLVILPYPLAIGYAVYPTVLAIQHPGLVSLGRTGFYCSIQVDTPSLTVATTILLMLFVTTVFEILIGINLWRNRCSFKSVQVQGWKSVQLFARLGVFQLYSLLAWVTWVEAVVAPERLERIFFQAALPTVAFLTFGTRPSLFQRGLTTIHEEQKGLSVYDTPCPTICPTGTEEQSESSPPRSYFSTARFASPIWPFWAHKKSPSQPQTFESHSDSCASQAPLRLDPNKMQIPSATSSTDSHTLRYSIRSDAIGDLSLSTIPHFPLDIPPTFTTSSIPPHSPSHSLTIRQQEPQSSQLVSHQLSEDRPIRRLPIPPVIGQIPIYVPKEWANHQHSSIQSMPQEKSGLKEPDQSAVSIAVIEVQPETSIHYDPLRTDSSSTGHRRDESVVTVGGPGQAEGRSIAEPERTDQIRV